MLVLAAVPAAATAGPPPGNLPNSPATDTDETFFADQWNMQQITLEAAHAITGGSPLVRVALIDSGIDPGHPEFAGRIDTANSASCATGSPVTDPSGALWRDQIGHGTQVAGLLAAGDNGFGIVGVAPHVQLVVIKVANAGQPITPAATACAFEYAADQHVDVANASFAVDKGPTASGDPLDFFCRSEKADKPAIALVKRAVRAARRAGVTIIASTGNNNLDLAHPAVGNDCIRMPVELPGVIGVSNEGRFQERALVPPSNYGVGAVDVTAPGGDDAQGGNPGGRVLTTFPSYIPVPPVVPPNVVDPEGGPGATYRFTAGTSFAAAHVSGLAALVISRFGDTFTPENGKMRPGQVEAFLQATTEDIGEPGYDEFFGHGEVDALAAVTHDPAS